jgi:hypothetical protein
MLPTLRQLMLLLQLLRIKRGALLMVNERAPTTVICVG